MATFKIVSDNTTLGKPGDTVTSDALEGLNVEALVAGGHLEPVSISSRKQHKQEQD